MTQMVTKCRTLIGQAMKCKANEGKRLTVTKGMATKTQKAR